MCCRSKAGSLYPSIIEKRSAPFAPRHRLHFVADGRNRLLAAGAGRSSGDAVAVLAGRTGRGGRRRRCMGIRSLQRPELACMLALACKCLGTCTLSCIGVQDNAVMPGPSWALGRAPVGQRIARSRRPARGAVGAAASETPASSEEQGNQGRERLGPTGELASDRFLDFRRRSPIVLNQIRDGIPRLVAVCHLRGRDARSGRSRPVRTRWPDRWRWSEAGVPRLADRRCSPAGADVCPRDRYCRNPIVERPGGNPEVPVRRSTGVPREASSAGSPVRS